MQTESYWIFLLVSQSYEEEKHLDVEQKSVSLQSQDKAKDRFECSWGKTELVLTTFLFFKLINTLFAIPSAPPPHPP